MAGLVRSAEHPRSLTGVQSREGGSMLSGDRGGWCTSSAPCTRVGVERGLRFPNQGPPCASPLVPAVALLPLLAAHDDQPPTGARFLIRGTA